MKVVLPLLSLALLTLFYLLYGSFTYAREIYLFSFLLTPLELTVMFYLCVATVIFFAHKKHLLQLKEKKEIYELSLVHFSLLASLVFVSQYTYSIFFVFFIFVTLLDFKHKNRNNFIFLLYLFFVHYALVLLFTADFILLYFLNIVAAGALFYKQKRVFSKSEYLACGISIALLLVTFNSLNAFIYDIYIWLDVVDAPIFINTLVLCLLSLLHIFLLFFALFKRK